MGRKTIDLLPKNSPKEFVEIFADEWQKRIENAVYLKYDKLLPESLEVVSVLSCKSKLVLVTLRNEKKNLFRELDNLARALHAENHDVHQGKWNLHPDVDLELPRKSYPAKFCELNLRIQLSQTCILADSVHDILGEVIVVCNILEYS
jgi:hypothetical protein